VLVKVFKIYFVGYTIKIRETCSCVGEWMVLYLISIRYGAIIIMGILE